MTQAQRALAEQIAADFEAGALTSEKLRQGLEHMARPEGARRQDILYLQSGNTSPSGPVVGMLLIEDGQPSDGPADPDEWPYQTVLEAVRDGWRIISFPNMALLAVPESEPMGLGFEFILERWS